MFKQSKQYHSLKGKYYQIHGFKSLICISRADFLTPPLSPPKADKLRRGTLWFALAQRERSHLSLLSLGVRSGRHASSYLSSISSFQFNPSDVIILNTFMCFVVYDFITIGFGLVLVLWVDYFTCVCVRLGSSSRYYNTVVSRFGDSVKNSTDLQCVVLFFII